MDYGKRYEIVFPLVPRLTFTNAHQSLELGIFIAFTFFIRSCVKVRKSKKSIHSNHTGQNKYLMK